MSVRLIPLADPAAWQTALSGIAHGPAHTHWYNAALARTVEDEIALIEYSSDRDRALCPILLRRYAQSVDITVPYGFGGFAVHGECGELPDQLRDFAVGEGWVCGYLTVHLLASHPFATGDGLETGRTLYAIDLSLPEADRLAAMHPNHRYEIRRDRHLLSALVTHAGAIAEALPALYAQTLARVGASDTYRFCDASLFAWLSSPGCVAFGLGDPLEAVIVCLHAEAIADYFIYASTEDGRRYSRVLLWAAACELKCRGVRLFNLGGGVRAGDSLEDFKRRFGGRAVGMPVLKQVYCRDEFDTLCAGMEAAKQSNGYFPPYRQ